MSDKYHFLDIMDRYGWVFVAVALGLVWGAGQYERGYIDALNDVCAEVGGVPTDGRCVHPEAIMVPPVVSES